MMMGHVSVKQTMNGTPLKESVRFWTAAASKIPVEVQMQMVIVSVMQDSNGTQLLESVWMSVS